MKKSRTKKKAVCRHREITKPAKMPIAEKSVDVIALHMGFDRIDKDVKKRAERRYR